MASKSIVKIEQVRKSVTLNNNQKTQVYNKNEILELINKVEIFIKEDSGSEVAILYLKKVLEKDPNNTNAKMLMDSLSNTSM